MPSSPSLPNIGAPPPPMALQCKHSPSGSSLQASQTPGYLFLKEDGKVRSVFQTLEGGWKAHAIAAVYSSYFRVHHALRIVIILWRPWHPRSNTACLFPPVEHQHWRHWNVRGLWSESLKWKGICREWGLTEKVICQDARETVLSSKADPGLWFSGVRRRGQGPYEGRMGTVDPLPTKMHTKSSASNFSGRMYP